MKQAICRAGVALLVGFAAVPASATSECKIGRILELPVTMSGMGPMIDARINGLPARLMADSGAFFSMISPAYAQSLHLPVVALPGMAVKGIGGAATVGLANLKTFTLAGVDIPHVRFLVGGSEVAGSGVIGQDILGFADVEYDLPHGVIRLMRSGGDCGHANLAYWAAGRSLSVMKINPRDADHPHTVGTITINGKPVRATFDTGASTTLLSMAAAARIGLRPGGPGVVEGDEITGIGHRRERTWIGAVDDIAIGDGEQIHHARVRFGATDAVFDMLIGADFFIAHRIYVDHRHSRLFLTYEGGPIFNIKARFDGPAPGVAPATTAAAAAAIPPQADALSRDGAVALARGDPDTAIAAFSKAMAAAPTEPRYRTQRAEAYLRRHETAPAMADLDEAIRLAPDDVDTRIARATMLLKPSGPADRPDRPAALADLDVADRVADRAAMQRLSLGELLVEAGQPHRAIAQFDPWLKAHPDDVRRPVALNGRCWARGMAGEQLDGALTDCNAALRARPGAPGYLDSRGIVELRLGALGKARQDFDAALAKKPGLPWSLYGRGLVHARTGDEAGANADIAAATAIRPHIAEEAAGFGIVR